MVSRTTVADALIEAGVEPETAERAARMIDEGQSASAGQAEMDERFDRVDGQLGHLDERLTGHERVIGARLQTNERELQAVSQRVEDLKSSTERGFNSTERELQAANQRVEALKDSTEREFKSTEREFKGVNLRISDLRSEVTGRISDLKDGMEQRISDLKDGMEQRFTDLKDGMDQRFTDLKDSMEQRFKEHKESMEQGLAQHKEHTEQNLAQLKESLEAKIDSEVAVLRSEIEAVRHEQRVMRWVVGIGFTLMLGGFGAVIALLVHILNRLP